MKYLFIVWAVFSPWLDFGQGIPGSQPKQAPPAFYLDSQRVDLRNFYLDVDHIQNIQVENGPIQPDGTKGSIYISLKHPLTKLLRLEDIAMAKGAKKERTVYFIDDSVIKNPAEIRIDSSYMIMIHYFSTPDLPFLKQDHDPFDILLILTKNATRLPKPGEQVHMIR